MTTPRFDATDWVGLLSDRNLLPDDVVCTFAAGSVVRGWGNVFSDLDLYVVTGGPWSVGDVDPTAVQVTPGVIPSASLFADDVRLDVEYWRDDLIAQLVERVSWTTYDDEATDGDVLTRDEIDILERMTYGRALTGTAWLDEQRQTIQDSALKTLLVQQRLNLASIFMEDARGQLGSGDLECAVLSARAAFGHSVDALMADAGEIGHSAKWRPRRFRSVNQDVLAFGDYWRLETMASFDARRPAGWVDEVLASCRRIALRIESGTSWRLV